MGVILVNIPKYGCLCDNCKKYISVSKTNEIYNGAQAVRSLGWSFGKDGKVLCDECRKENYKDNYRLPKKPW